MAHHHSDEMSSMGSMGMFKDENQYRAKVLWFVVAAWVALLTLLRVFHAFQRTSRPTGWLSQSMATGTAIYREFAYPQPIWFTGRVSKFFTPPPIGRIVLLGCYWVMILILLWSDVLLADDDPYRWEKVGFRAAWVSVTQIPLVYLLSCKINPVSMLTGISYERFNWLHRWAARTVFLTIIVHWSYFFREWWLADFVQLELEMMPMVNYGFGAWAVIGWMVLTGFGFIRAACYELFVAQHVLAAAVLLWLIFVHVPAYAAYNVWLSVSFVVFDWSARLLLGLVRNTHLLQRKFKFPGYAAAVERLPGEVTRLTIEDPGFSWKAGQHVYLSIPALRPLELHPFTIASVPGGPLSLLLKAHSGFSSSLYKSGKSNFRVFLNGPFGRPPSVVNHETVVFIACSTGVTFTLPILQEMLSKSDARQVFFHWIVRKAEHTSWLSDELIEAERLARRSDVQSTICTHVTDAAEQVVASQSSSSSLAGSTSMLEKTLQQVESVTSANSASSIQSQAHGRPRLDDLVCPAVERATGETAIIACGGLAFTAELRTYVAALSDERAVHKGTGAQGIFLFTETYGWG